MKMTYTYIYNYYFFEGDIYIYIYNKITINIKIKIVDNYLISYTLFNQEKKVKRKYKEKKSIK